MGPVTCEWLSLAHGGGIDGLPSLVCLEAADQVPNGLTWVGWEAQDRAINLR